MTITTKEAMNLKKMSTQVKSALTIFTPHVCEAYIMDYETHFCVDGTSVIMHNGHGYEWEKYEMQSKDLANELLDRLVLIWNNL